MTTNPAPQKSRSNLTTEEVCAQLGVARSTLYRWWDKGVGPRRFALPGGAIRVKQAWLDDFITHLEEAAA